MKKAWEAYHNEQPKFDANWDRSAKRVVVVQPPPKEVPKTAKPKPVKQTKTKDSAFEEVVFVTPPVTPPPPPPEKLAEAKDVKRDDEFWNLYNKKI